MYRCIQPRLSIISPKTCLTFLYASVSGSPLKMVQRKVSNKLSIKPHLLKSDTKLEHLRPLSPKSHDRKKIMKKPRPATVESQPPPPVRKKRVRDAGATPEKQSPNYMKSTSSFDARKERKISNDSEKVKSLKVVRTLTKTPSFKPSRPLKKCSPVVLSARRMTCSSTLKDSKFPSYLELSHGGSEVEGTSAVKVCPYNYCSLNGHHHTPVPPLRCFLAGKRRAMKTQKSFKVGCLSPRQTKPGVKKNEENVTEVIFADEGPEGDMEVRPVTPVIEEEEENRDFFVEIYSKDREDLECSAMDWEDGYCSASSVDDGKTLKSPEIEGGDDDDREEQIEKNGFESLYSRLQELYDEESVSSGAWSESDGDYDDESDSLYQQMKINHQNETEEDENTGFEAKMDEVQGLNLPTGDHEETSLESETVSDFNENSPEGNEKTDKHHTTIIYNIIQYNISIFINGEKTEHSKTDKLVTVQVPGTSGEVNPTVADELPADDQHIESGEQLDTSCLTDTQESPEEECDESQACSRSNSMDFESDNQSEINEEPTSKSDEKPEISGEDLPDSSNEEPASKSDETLAISGEELPESSIDLKESTRIKKTDKQMEDSGEYNLRGPNFLPEVADPDAETVDLKHQTIDERKNAEEWMRSRR
ncbi:hypothetical protein L2E82_29697 [Cichorium intybus]|uniref:Uncharacterized protein n=1 Tax=Cichorium intybus TaxID=13427 RepID=A0ACB9CYC3_CICIN|nr:hypothetical protein L2E82_29697 [Cichorium intybus]